MYEIKLEKAKFYTALRNCFFLISVGAFMKTLMGNFQLSPTRGDLWAMKIRKTSSKSL